MISEGAVEARFAYLEARGGLTDSQAIADVGFVPLSKTGAELLFELVSQRYERNRF